jgi:HAD superfamily phosphatase (TIGR01668 family)
MCYNTNTLYEEANLSMSFSLLPGFVTRKLTDVTPEFLQRQGIKLLMLDFDNTIVPYTTNIPTMEMEHWLSEMSKSDIQLCVVSNSKRDRVKNFCRNYGIDCITHANKPFPKGIEECRVKYGLDSRECALVGDQIFTDTLGANGCGVTSILVKAIDNHNIWLKLRHVAETPFILMARKRRIK